MIAEKVTKFQDSFFIDWHLHQPIRKDKKLLQAITLPHLALPLSSLSQSTAGFPSTILRTYPVDAP